MEFLGNKVIMQQGEDFVIDSVISQSSSKYIPYVVSKQLDNQERNNSYDRDGGNNGKDPLNMFSRLYLSLQFCMP